MPTLDYYSSTMVVPPAGSMMVPGTGGTGTTIPPIPDNLLSLLSVKLCNDYYFGGAIRGF